MRWVTFTGNCEAHLQKKQPETEKKITKRPKKRLPRFLSEAEMEILFRNADRWFEPWFASLLDFIYTTGARVSEAINLRVGDINVQEGHAQLLGKGSKERLVPLPKALLDHLAPYLKNKDKDQFVFLTKKGHRPSRVTVYIYLRQATEEFGRKVGPHQLRHSCATHLMKRGAPIRQLQDLLGHASLASTQIYTHVTINDLKVMQGKFGASLQAPHRKKSK